VFDRDEDPMEQDEVYRPNTDAGDGTAPHSLRYQAIAAAWNAVQDGRPSTLIEAAVWGADWQRRQHDAILADLGEAMRRLRDALRIDRVRQEI
jgi:hypothetical protein